MNASRHGAFPSTSVSLVQLAAKPDAPGWQEAWERFFREYWQPLYGYLRRTGSEREEALDLLQEFFLRGSRGTLLQRYDPARGRLRTFLLTCLGNLRRKAWRAERVRPDRHACLRAEDAPEPVAGDPEQSFEREWSRCVRLRAIERVRVRLAEEGDPLALGVLDAWVLCPERPPATEVAASLGLSPNALYTRATRLRQSLVAEVERALRWFAARPEELASERDAVLRSMREG